MTEREALKLALEALEFIPKSGSMLGAQAEAKRLEAITAIKEALAQPWEKFCDSNCVWTDHHPNCKLAEPAVTESHKQEPVTWRNAAIRVGEDLCSVGPFGYYDMTAEQWLDWALSVVTVHAPPPQRKPLTDEEKDRLANAWFSKDGDTDVAHRKAIALIEEVEAAHGIKEEA